MEGKTMKNTGIVRKIDPLGRIVLPMEVRKILDIPERTPMEIYAEGETIVLKKYEPNCLFCDDGDDLITFKGKHICKSCLKDLRDDE
jgi:transcriptional pleiotropic regulator of transition state genes